MTALLTICVTNAEPFESKEDLIPKVLLYLKSTFDEGEYWYDDIAAGQMRITVGSPKQTTDDWWK